MSLNTAQLFEWNRVAFQSHNHPVAAHYRGNPNAGFYVDSAVSGVASGIHHGADRNSGYLVSGRSGHLHGRHSNVRVRVCGDILIQHREFHSPRPGYYSGWFRTQIAPKTVPTRSVGTRASSTPIMRIAGKKQITLTPKVNLAMRCFSLTKESTRFLTNHFLGFWDITYGMCKMPDRESRASQILY